MEQDKRKYYTANTVPEDQVICRFTASNNFIARCFGHLRAQWRVIRYNNSHTDRRAGYKEAPHEDYRLKKFKVFYNLINSSAKK